MNILQALDDEQVFGPFFRGPTWVVWRVFLAVLFGLPLTSEQLALYTKHTGRTVAPTSPLHEAWLVCGQTCRQDLSSSRVFQSSSQHSRTGGRFSAPVSAAPL